MVHCYLFPSVLSGYNVLLYPPFRRYCYGSTELTEVSSRGVPNLGEMYCEAKH